MKVFILVVLGLVVNACAVTPEKQRGIQSHQTACHFTELSDYFEREKLFNILLEFGLSVAKDDLSGISPQRLEVTWQSAELNSFQACGAPRNRNFFNGKSLTLIGQDHDRIVFQVYGRNFEMLRRSDRNQVEVAFYAEDRITMQLSFEHEKPTLFTLRGRSQIANDQQIIAFFDPAFRLKNYKEFPPAETRRQSISSLQSIYQDQKSNVVKNLADSSEVIGVIGSGVDYNHPALAKHLKHRLEIEEHLILKESLGRKLHTYVYISPKELLSDLKQFIVLEKNTGFPKWLDHVDGSVFPYDDVKPFQPKNRHHETMVSSRIVNGLDGVQILPVRIPYNSQNRFTDIISQMKNHGVKVVNLSFGYLFDQSDPAQKEWSRTFSENQDILFIISAGNLAQDIGLHAMSPAIYSKEFSNVITVASLGSDLKLSKYASGGGSNFSKDFVTVAIRGDDLMVAVPNSTRMKQEPFGGTSVAAAEVTRLSHKLLKKHTWMKPHQVKAHLLSCSKKTLDLKGKTVSSGYIDENRCLNFKPVQDEHI